MKQNIYLLYPPGYSGSYISWCLHKSNTKTSEETINNPLNLSENEKFGGKGTSHLHQRIPTHLVIENLIGWLIKNKPSDKKIYLLNSISYQQTLNTIAVIQSFDDNPIIIQIATNDFDYRHFGYIQSYSKWSVFYKFKILTENYYQYNINLSDDLPPIVIRNTLVKHFDLFEDIPNIIDFSAEDEIMNYHKRRRQREINWYNVRSKAHPHEVNDSQFFVNLDLFPKNFFVIKLEEIMSINFIDILESLILNLDIDTYNFTYCKNFHKTYIDAQSNLQYLEDIKKFRNENELSNFLCGSPIVQAVVIKQILNCFPRMYNWEQNTLQKIANDYNIIRNKIL